MTLFFAVLLIFFYLFQNAPPPFAGSEQRLRNVGNIVNSSFILRVS